MKPKIYDSTIIAMKQIPDSVGRPDVFYLLRDGGERWLYANLAWPDRRWYAVLSFVFRLRKEPLNS